jgi:tyrosine-protein kinase
VLSQAASDTQLHEYVAVLSRRRWLVVATGLVTIASTLLFSLLQTPIYRSTAEVLVRPASLSSTQGQEAPNMDTEKQLAQSQAVAYIVRRQLGLQVTSTSLLKHLSVSVSIGTEIISFAYSDPDRDVARARAQAFALGYLTFRRNQFRAALKTLSNPIQDQLNALTDQLTAIQNEIARTTGPARLAELETQAASINARISVLEQRLSDLTPPQGLQVGALVTPASRPLSPASPNLTLNVVLGAFVGLVLGFGLAFLRERLDTRLSSMGALARAAGTPVLGEIPAFPRRLRQGRDLVVLAEPTSVEAESFRILSTNVLATISRLSLRTMLVTSPGKREGKTSTTANLAVALAQRGRKIALISGDLRRPRLDEIFLTIDGIDLEGTARLITPSAPSTETGRLPTGIEGLTFVSTHQVGRQPGTNQIDAEALSYLLQGLRREVDLILIDSGPLLLTSDSAILAELADGVLLVADAQATTRAAMAKTRHQLDVINREVVGAVLTNVPRPDTSEYSYYRSGEVAAELHLR